MPSCSFAVELPAHSTRLFGVNPPRNVLATQILLCPENFLLKYMTMTKILSPEIVFFTTNLKILATNLHLPTAMAFVQEVPVMVNFHNSDIFPASFTINCNERKVTGREIFDAIRSEKMNKKFLLF